MILNTTIKQNEKNLSFSNNNFNFVLNAKSEDTLVSAFFGLDNGLPSLLCNQLSVRWYAG